jgi:NarL family two-component system response regulator YdfI
MGEAQPEKLIRVLVADDHLIVREGLRLLLETDPRFCLVGEAEEGSAAVRLAKELAPDVVLMDLRMPGMDGLEAIERLQAEAPHLAIVILTTYNDDELMIRGLRAGARSFLLKDVTPPNLFRTIQAAANGEMLIQPAIMQRVLAHPTPPPPDNSIAADHTNLRSMAPIDLTERERDVLAGLVRGDRSKEIARKLGISERTVKAYLSSIYSKLGVDSRTAAVAVCLKLHLLDPSTSENYGLDAPSYKERF